ncbi:hypothetical protein BV25DRAFT_1992016 [Artomyces pyxidatus]|uniref:Uncharacterized protein n=1 Tax=Artomyces pyxidatus TaxID=48021 RepID=A0ACB8SZL2_9AGAM|nr:hypothetical protein BV25DRAFT_1992016 [Artomyces pyxidatus]
MVSSLLVEALSSPTDVLNDLYEYQDKTALGDFPQTVTKHFSDIFRTDEAFSEIPALTTARSLSSYRDRALVRFRAMVQDTSPAPEMYLSKLKSGKCGGWGLFDTLKGDGKEEELDYADLRDCTVAWAVSVPGESEWYAKSLDGECDGTDGPVQEPPRSHKFPIPKEPHIGVQIKIYNVLGNDTPKTAEVLNFVGILTSEPLHTESDVSIDVPTLHVLFTRQHTLGITSGVDTVRVVDEPVPNSEDRRQDLINWIAEEALGGDLDAAEWVLLTCIARVQSRTRSLHPPSLTLSHFPSASTSTSTPTPTLSHVLALLLPLSLSVHLSLDLLNRVPFVPESKDEDLHSGLLQLSPGTTIVINESGVQEGQLIERGVLNVLAVQNVMTSQTLSYKFPFSEFSFPTDVNFIVLSQGSKSALWKTDFTLPLDSPTSNEFYKTASEIRLPPAETLAAFRQLIVSAKTGKIEVGESTSQHIQDEFVQERKADSSVSSDDLKQAISVARLIGLSMQEKEVNIKVWERAKELEKRRKARFA